MNQETVPTGLGDCFSGIWGGLVLRLDLKKVIFTKYSQNGRKRCFPYPPVYQEKDTDYICFTDSREVVSGSWRVICVEDVETAELGSWLDAYGDRYELEPDQVQMGPVWDAQLTEETSVVRVPELEKLPGIKLDLAGFVPTADENGNYIYRKNPVYRDGKYKGRPLLLTIGVPVSNQIDTIERCLAGIKPLLDGIDSELVVIDTGSTDGTLDVCRRYGARIVAHPWHDNMSAARNEGIYNARGLWYMSIDDDEWFEDVTDILDFFEKGTWRGYNTATYIQRNYNDFAGNLYEDYHTLRMAEITSELHFEGRIHDAMVLQERKQCAALGSFAHHYGFVKDTQGRMAAKSRRNMSILPYDIYEYPLNLRYLFQFAQECAFVGHSDTAVRLFVQVIALARELEDACQGKNSVMKLCDTLNRSGDSRLFSWMEFLPGLFSLTTAERAAVAWYQIQLGATLQRPAAQIIGYWRNYEALLGQYRQNPCRSREGMFSGLSLVEHEFFVMDVAAVAFWKYIELGCEDEALALLRQIPLDVVDNKRGVLFGAGFAAGNAVYDLLCGKLTSMQWEEWSGMIISSLAVSLKQKDIYERQAERFSDVLSKLSVPSVVAWIKKYEGRNKGQTGMKLVQYAMGCSADTASVQELCLCSRILREEYAKRQGAPESTEYLRKYIVVTGMFAERYYSHKELSDAKSRVVAPEIRAACGMAAALSDGQASDDDAARFGKLLAENVIRELNL